MTSNNSRGSAFRSKPAGRLALSAGALVAVVGAAVLVPSAAAMAAPAQGIAPQAVITSGYADVVSNVKVDSISNINGEGKLTWRSVLATSFDFKVPNDAAPGDTFQLTMAEADRFRFMDFEGLEIKDSSGTVIATAKSTGNYSMEITLTDAVALSENIVGKATVTIQPHAQPGADIPGKLTLLGADGANLGPNLDYVIAPPAPVNMGIVPTGKIIHGNEVGLQVTWNYTSTGPVDLSQVELTFQADEPGLLPDCTADGFGVKWVKGGGYELVNADITSVVKSCDLETGTLVLGFPEGATMPSDATGFTMASDWVGDTPSKDYDITGTIAVGDQKVTRTGTGRTPALEGAADGQVRAAKTTISKTSNAPERLLVGGKFNYTIETVNNEELRTAYGVVTSDPIPAGLEVIAVDNGGVYKDGVVTWPAADIAPGASLKYGIRVRVTDASADVITNKASNVGINTCFDGDKTGSVCEASVSDTLTRVAIELDKQELGVEDTNGNGVVGDPGDRIQYGFGVTNKGNAAESVLTLEDKLLGIEGQEFILDIPLQPGESTMLPGEFYYTITEADGAAEVVVNEASVSVPDAPPSTDVVETPTKPAPTPEPTATPTSTPAPAPTATPVATVDLAKTGGDAQAAIWTGAGLITAAAGAFTWLFLRRRKADAVAEQN